MQLAQSAQDVPVIHRLDHLKVYEMIPLFSCTFTLIFIGAAVLLIWRLSKGSAPHIHHGPRPPDAPAAWFNELLQLAAQAPTAHAQQYMQSVKQLHALIQQAQQLQAQQGSTGASLSLPPDIQIQFQAQLLKMQQAMSDFDRLAQERCELSRGSMLSQAAAVGINVNRDRWGM